MKFKTMAAAGLVAMFSQTAQAESLTIVITGIEETRGEIRLALFDSAEAFDNGGTAAQGRLAPVTEAEVTVVIDDIAAGEYAIKLFHDTDSNGELDRNMMGMPRERYGFSNNKGRFGPPPWQEAVFVVAEGTDTEISINLR